MRKTSLLRRIDAYFTANPTEGLALSDACTKFGCTAEQFAMAVRKANHLFGLGLGIENYYRLGVSTKPKKRVNGTTGVPFQPGKVSTTIFSSKAVRVRMPPSVPLDRGLLSVRSEAGNVVVARMLAQETEEWKERERARRARQKLPKPPSTAKTRSKKLLELVGNDQDA